ncbi:MAG: translation initiation factor IF-2 N-terminal domain-containing protein, partial [Clostridiales Family XIII bacterium]|nr:translation initiation factor IF-2 N-terminal domain-containing protein [Clostridiales Family XIII bacterium]
MKVSELAKELKKTNKEIIEKANELGIPAKGATKNLDDIEVSRIRSSFESHEKEAAEEQKSRLMPRRKPKAIVEEEKRQA